MRTGPYAGAQMVIGTMHGKQHQVGPAFAALLGAEVIAPTGLDTDRFGTFTGDVERSLPAAATAAAKAREAMVATGIPYGLASEASYNTRYGAFPVHEEILIFLDEIRGIEVLECDVGADETGCTQRVVTQDAAHTAARSFGFPHQGATVRTVDVAGVRVFGRGLTDLAGLSHAVRTALDSGTGPVWVGPDHRAHHNPSRRAVLRRLAGRLARRLATACPGCHSPGYGAVGERAGLPCRVCGTPTDLALGDVHGCPGCTHTTFVRRTETTADPGWCPMCNP